MIDKVARFVEEKGLIRKGDTVLVALSGGPDSVALLDVLRQLSTAYSLSLLAAHLNHGLRKEAHEDQVFVEDLCRTWGVRLFVEEADVGAFAQAKGMSREEAGRHLRYSFLYRVKREAQADKIATAHHMQDQAETLLIRLIQGTGPRGLQGMLPRRGDLIRPLLETRKEEIMDYVHRNHLPYRIDYSNYDLCFLRNRIRHEVLPVLEKLNPRIVESLCRLAEMMAEENRYWDEETEKLKEQLLKPGVTADKVLSVSDLMRLSLPLRRRFLHRVLADVGARRLTYDDVEKVLNLLSKPGSTKTVEVLGGMRVRKAYDSLELNPLHENHQEFCYEVPVPGLLEVPELGILIETRLVAKKTLPKPGIEVFDWDKIKKPLYVRSRRAGDRIRFKGMKGEKKVKDYFIEKKIPYSLRGKIGILASDSEIYWIINHRRADQGCVSEDTCNFLEVEVRRSQ